MGNLKNKYYTTLENIGPKRDYDKNGLEYNALKFIRESCIGLRFDEEKMDDENPDKGIFLGTSLNENQIPYNMQMDIDRLCLERAVERFLRSGKKEDAFDVYFCYLEMFVGDYKKTRRMIELLSEFEANGSSLLMKHRDHYSHSVYVFCLGLAIYESNSIYREAYKNYYADTYKDCSGLTDENKAACHYLRYWGLASLFHDIGYPFELPFEQVESYFEVDGDKREERPFVSYQNLSGFVKLDKKTQRQISRVYHLNTNKIIRTTDELFAYVLSEKLSDTYYFSEQEMLDYLKKKPTEPNQFNFFMDHAYFSATVLFKKLFCELNLDLNKEYMDSLTAIILHNSLYKFSVAFYKDSCCNIPLKAELHPLAYMLMLCDELQCWDRTAYGRNSRLELHPMGCEFDFSGDAIKATYIYDESEKGKITEFEEEYEQWKTDHRGVKPKLKAYSGMYIKNKDGVSDFKEDIERIVDLTQITLVDEIKRDSREKVLENSKRYLSESNFLNLYNFALVLNGRWGCGADWKKAKEDGQMEKFISDKDRIKQFTDSFDNLSLEYKLSNINQAKAFAKYMNEIGCFYTDKPVDFKMVESFIVPGWEEDMVKIGHLEHQRWLQEHYDMGWKYIDEKDLTERAKEKIKKSSDCPDEQSEEFKKKLKKQVKLERENNRQHWDMIPDDNVSADVPIEAATVNYDRLSKAEQDKDTDPMECMLTMLKMFDGLRIYRLN